MGQGWGADAGFTYEYRPHEAPHRPQKGKKPKAELVRPFYLFRVGVSITDIGAVSYKTNTQAFPGLVLKDVAIQSADYDGLNIRNYEARLPAIFHTAGQTPQHQYTAGLPTALNVDVDYHMAGPLFINAALSQSLRGTTAIGMRSYSYASLAPRLETPQLELAVPVSLTNNYQLVAVGALLRLGFLTIGSNNLSAFLASAHPYGANVFAEASLLKIAAKRKTQ